MPRSAHRGRRLKHFAIATLALCILAAGTFAAAQWATSSSASTATFSSASGWLPPGPWGQVQFKKIVIFPPSDHTKREETVGSEGDWILPDTDQAQLAMFLANLHLPTAQLLGLAGTAQPDAAADGYAMTPSPSMIRHLPAQARRTLYDRLAQNAVNLPQANAFRYWGSSVTHWLSQAGVPDATVSRVARLSYHNGPLIFFADLPLVLKQLPNDAARQQLVRGLCAQATLQLTLHIHHGENIKPLVRYWGAGGRQKQISSLLTAAIAGKTNGTINVRDLLPPFARHRLYHYPSPQTSLPAGDSRDCHWSALNFFSTAPQERFADKAVVATTLHNQYHPVARPRFGDLVEFISNGVIFHSAVYIADGILFTKNGARLSQPWELLPISVMRHFYPKSGNLRIVYLRHNTLNTGDH